MGEKKSQQSAPNQALYRRYRSTSFDELVGQEHVTDLLKIAVASGTISHAYLFTGQRGTGKTSAARILAHAINQLPYENSDGGHLDIIEIDAASNRRIDDIRDLREKVFIAPVSAKYKVYIIDEVHMLTGESFNALLKTLEEPPAHAVFILATTELHKVPATIVSRTQRFHFRPVAQARVIDHLQSIADQEKVVIDQPALQLVAAHGGGSFRDSISLLDQLASLNQPITAEVVERILGRARSADIAALVTVLEARDQASIQTLLGDMLSGGISPVTLSEQLVAELLKNPRPGKDWYALSERLMSVTKAHFPELLLTTLLLGFAASEATVVPKKLAVPAAIKPAEKTKKVEETSEELLKEQPDLAKKAEPAAPKTDEQPQPTTAKSQGDGTLNWEAVLAAAKKNPALHSVLQRASINYENSVLTLSFQYALHRKKLDQTQYRTGLARLIQDVCNISPTIEISGSAPSVAANETVKKVADLMGGGDVVTV